MSLMDEANTWPASRPGRRPIIWPEGRGTYGNTGHRKYNICLASVCVFSHTHTSGGRLVCVYYHTHTPVVVGLRDILAAFTHKLRFTSFTSCRL